MAKYYSGIETGTTLDSMLASGSDFGIFPSQDIDCQDISTRNVNVTGIHTVGGFFYPNGGIKDSSNSIGSSGKVLSSTGSGLAWIDPSEGSTENAVNVGTNLNSTNASQFIAFLGANSGNNPIRVNANLTYNPSTNILSVPSITMSSHLNIDGNIRSVAGNLELQAVSGENGLVIKDNNAVELYFDGSATYKLATKTDGVDVRGELEADSLNVTGISTVGALTIDVNGTDEGSTTLLTLDNYINDIGLEYTWIDFTFRDSNTNATPQVKIGAQAKDPTGNQTQEGTADFVVQCGVDLNSTSNTMTEMFRCSHETKIISVHHHPQTHSNFDLGSNNLRWRNLYATIIRDKDNQTGTSGQVLSSTGTEISWINVGDISAGSAARIAVTDQSSDTTCFPVFTQGATGNQLPHTVSSLTFNSSTGALSAASFSGSIAASNINSGTLGTDRIPNLNASKINAGTLGTDRIPNLAASKITSGTLGTDRIPNLAASKITSGTLGTARIPNLAASKITSGTLGTDRIPNLNASKITAGTLGTDRIPSLPASKITSGQFDAARIPTLNQNTTGNSATATTLQNPRNIGGVSFNGSENINLPGVNIAGNQNTSGNSGSATVLETSRTIGGVSFNGSANINLPGVNIAGNQNTSGIADKAETARIVTDSSSALRPLLFIASSGSDNSAVNNTFASLKFSPTIFSLSYNPSTEILYVNKAQLNKIQVSSGGVGNAGQVLTSGGSSSNMTWTYPVPSGGIIIWSGAANNIPSGWVLCDGNNSTPDLRGRFVVGYSNTDNDYDVGDTGGNKQQTLSINQIPSHTHSYSSANHPTSSGPEQNQSGGPEDRTTFNVSKTTGNTGGGQPVDVRPPYYALCYIMKT